MGNAILYRMPSGIPGDVSRLQSATIDSAPLNASLPFPGFGLPGKLASGKFVPIAAGDTAASVLGFLVRTYPTQGSDAAGATPVASGIASVLRRGHMTVMLNSGTAARGGQVYVRIAAPSGAKVVGGIEAAADSTNTIAVTGCTFQAAADASGNVEIEYNI